VTSAPSILNLQDWPGREGVSAKPNRRQPFDRLGDRSGLVLVAAAERYATEERFGLGAFLSITGRSVHGAGLVVPDDLPERRVQVLRAWCASHGVDTPAGPRPWECFSLSEFFDYRTGPFTRRVYCGAGWLVTADLGRTLGLVIEAWAPARATRRSTFWRGAFKGYLPTWSKIDDRKDHEGRLVSVSPHRPAFNVKTAGAHGYIAQFDRAPGGQGAGKRNPDGSAYRGRFLDVVQAGYVFDGVDSGDLADHLKAFGLDRLDLPAAVTIDAEGAGIMAGLVGAVRSLTIVLDEEASKWFTTSGDRARGYARVNIGGLVSPAGLAAEIPRKAGVTPPLVKFRIPTDLELRCWIAAHRGGWLSAELAGKGLFLAVDIDVHSAYPAFASLLGWWPLMTAACLRRRDVTEELRALCVEMAAGDVSAFFDRRTWRHFGFTICEVICDGEPWPVEAPDDDYPQGHSGVRPVRCPLPLPFTWPDVVLAALRSGRVPHIVSATKLVPVGRQPGLRDRYPLYDGLVLGIEDDPAVALVQLRDKAKDRGDVRLAAQLRIVVNTLCYGNPVRLDLGYRQEGRRRVVTETAAEWTFPPIAATVTAASRLALGVAEKLLDPYGITVASRDTDGLLLCCTPDQWPALDRVLARFDALDPFGTGQPFWKVQREHEGRSLHGFVIGIKRYVLATLDDAGDLLEVAEATEHALGGSVVDPPRMAGHDKEGHRRWTRAVAAVAVRREIAHSRGISLVVPLWPWERADEPRFPSIGRVQAATPETLTAIRRRIGVRPFGLFLEGHTRRSGDTTPVALDPGTDLAEWQSLDWRLGDGGPAHVDANVLDNLGGKAYLWLQPRPLDDRSEVVVVPELIRRVGKAGGVIEAEIVSPDADTSSVRAVYDEGDAAGFVVHHATEIGPQSFSRRYNIPLDTVESWACGRKRPSAGSVHRVLRAMRIRTEETPTCPVDGRPVFRSGAAYCSVRCRRREEKRRQREKAAVEKHHDVEVAS
jgi:hypothetical protein